MTTSVSKMAAYRTSSTVLPRGAVTSSPTSSWSSASRTTSGMWRSPSSWTQLNASSATSPTYGGGGGRRVNTLATTLSTALANATSGGDGQERRMTFPGEEEVNSVVHYYNNSAGISPSFNQTPSMYHYYGDAVVVPLCVFLSIAMVLAIVGNVMVILTIVKHKTMRTRTNMFIVNLAVADIMVAVFDMPFSILTLIHGNWVFGDGFCEFNSITMALFLDASIHTLMYISIHKYISITRPFSRFMTPKRIWLMIAVTWIWSITYAISGAAGWTDNRYKKGASQCGPDYPVGLLKFSHSICNTLFNFLIPLGVMSFCYFRIFREIRQHMWRMRENTNMDMKNSLLLQKRISVTLIGVLICFLICWTPYIVYSSYAGVAKDKVPLIMNPLAYWCGYINSACNPIIYAFRSPSFRQGYYSIVCGRQRQFQSTGSFSQRSPSFRRKTLPGTLGTNQQQHIGTNGGDSNSSGAKCPKQLISNKKRPKRLISQNSWANASMSVPVPLTPLGEPPSREGLRRPSRSDPFANESPPLLPRGCHDDASNGKTVAPSTVPSSPCKALAENSINMLSPILEGSLENVALNGIDTKMEDDAMLSDDQEQNESDSDEDIKINGVRKDSVVRFNGHVDVTIQDGGDKMAEFDDGRHVNICNNGDDVTAKVARDKTAFA